MAEGRRGYKVTGVFRPRLEVLEDRVVPGSVRPCYADAADLLESVDDMWAWVDQCYRDTWGRAAGAIERRFIADTPSCARFS